MDERFHISMCTDECIQKIFFYLTLRDIQTVKCVCKRWNELTSRSTTIVGRNDWTLIRGAKQQEGIITLTEAVMSSNGAALCKAKISTKNDTTIRISFQLYAGTGKRMKDESEWCGDGICFFIVDADKHDGKSIGQFGSALGYANIYRFHGIPHGLLGIGFDEWGNFARGIEGKDGLNDPEGKDTKWSISLRGPGHLNTGYHFLCYEKVPEWYEIWTKVDVTLEIEHRTLFLTLEMDNEILKKKKRWKDYKVDVTLPDNIGIGFSASTGEAINRHQVKDVKVVERFFSEDITSQMGNLTSFHTTTKK